MENKVTCTPDSATQVSMVHTSCVHKAHPANTIINILTGASAAKEVQFLTLADFPADDRDQLLLGAAARAKATRCCSPPDIWLG